MATRDELLELIESGPPITTGGSTTSRPLGLPEDAQSQPRHDIRSDAFNIFNKPSQPLHMPGDEWKPASLSPSEIYRLQQRLTQAGFIRPGQKIRAGVWDSISVSAYKRLLEFANQQGLPEDQAIGLYGPELEALEGGGFGTAMSGDQPTVINPNDVENMMGQLRQLASEYGVMLSDEQLRERAHAVVVGQMQQPTIDQSQLGSTTPASEPTSFGWLPEEQSEPPTQPEPQSPKKPTGPTYSEGQGPVGPMGPASR